MHTVIDNVRLIDPESGLEAAGALLIHGETIADVLTGAPPALPDGATRIDGGGACLAPGIVDLGVKAGEPGERHK